MDTEQSVILYFAMTMLSKASSGPRYYLTTLLIIIEYFRDVELSNSEGLEAFTYANLMDACWFTCRCRWCGHKSKQFVGVTVIIQCATV